MPRNNPYADVPAAPAELDLAELAQGREVELEIGFGRGRFILERAAARPEALLIGLEVRRKWVAKVSERARRAELSNVDLSFGDARHLLLGWRPDEVLAAVYLNFPDPWWKKRHLKRLVLVPETLAQIVRLLRPRGRLFVQTDVEERAEGYRALLESEPLLAEMHPPGQRFLADNPAGATSHRERKCREVGLPVFRLLFEKR